jgi:hypothetical protein
MDAAQINLCRICMQETQDDSKILIYRTEAANDLVANLIIDLADVECSSDDNLPDAICEICVDGLEKAYEFRKLIRKSDVMLRDMFEAEQNTEQHAIKQEHADIVPTVKYS